MSSDRLSRLQRLYSAVIADVLDFLGHRNQILGSDIRALTPANRLCGRVFTAKAVPVDEYPAEPYKLEMQAIDTMQNGDVLVVDAGHDCHSAFWGELLTTACIAKGVRGIAMTACCRDMWALSRMNFPVFGIGCTPADSAGRLDVTQIGEPIEIDGVTTKNGDYIICDLDGVVIVPEEFADDVLRLAEEKVAGENTVRERLRAGVPIAEVFKQYGIL
jgi:regulator of RNase E activity RraA